jgi:hypothetical protein
LYNFSFVYPISNEENKMNAEQAIQQILMQSAPQGKSVEEILGAFLALPEYFRKQPPERKTVISALSRLKSKNLAVNQSGVWYYTPPMHPDQPTDTIT